MEWPEPVGLAPAGAVPVSTLATGLDHPEGVCWHRSGGLFAGGEGGQIYHLTAAGPPEIVAQTRGFVLGLAASGNGDLLAVDVHRRELLTVDPATGAVAGLSQGAPDHPLRQPNHLAVDHTGGVYLTDSGGWGADDGAVLHIDPGGRTRVWSRAVPCFPNGCALAPGGRGLYVVESTLPGVTLVPIRPDGTAGEPAVVVRLPGQVPDGIAVAASGNLYVACYRPDRIIRITPAGVVTLVADDPTGQLLNGPANLTFAGPALDQLVVANFGGWHLTRLDVGEPGLPPATPGVGLPAAAPGVGR